MRKNLGKIVLLLTTCVALVSCAPHATSTLVGGEYNPAKNETDYFVLPYGSVTMPGKWTKTNYNSVSKQQFFRNPDSIILSVALGRYNKYEFNMDGVHTGFNFVKEYYEWDSKYFIDVHGLKREPLESDSTRSFMVYRIYGEGELAGYDTYFLVGEKNGNTEIFAISYTDKWTPSEKVEFLKDLFLAEENQ